MRRKNNNSNFAASMDKSRPNKIKSTASHLFAIAAILLVMLSSCPIKFSIKSFAGVPAKAEQASNKKINLFSANSNEVCNGFATDETAILQADLSSMTKGLLSATFFTAIIAFFFAITLSKGKAHLRFANAKIQPTFPIYLQYRKLLI
ncbi:MAG: hypothetical protein ACTHKY_11630 [Ginsengibacter sp.]